jgi:hypothetical protein
MLGVTGFGLIFTPAFYVVVRNWFDKRRTPVARAQPTESRS